MKRLILSLLFFVNACLASSEQLLVRAIDEEGNSIGGATVVVSYYVNRTDGGVGGDGRLITGSTNAGGECLVRLPGQEAATVVIEKGGYYRSERRLRGTNDRVEMVVRPVAIPIAMFAGRLTQGPGEDDETRSFDFEEGDWLPPFGRGKSADVFLTYQTKKLAEGADQRTRIFFPNDGDGIVPFDQSRFADSFLRSPRYAPSDGYAPEYTQVFAFVPGKPVTGNLRGEKGGYFLRIRTVKDPSGKIVSARYVKIYGDFPLINFYLNPTPNDRNMEFDPKANLIRRGYDPESRYRVGRP